MIEFAEPADAILARLQELRAADAPTHGGRVLSYVYDSGLAELDELAAAAIRAVQPVNGLDPTTFTSVAVLERETVGFVRDLLGGDRGCGGHRHHRRHGELPAGGQDRARHLAAVARCHRRARAWWRRPPCTRRSRRPRTTSTWTSTWCRCGPDGSVDAAAVIARIGDDVALVVLSAPNYPFAGLDPIEPVAAACADAGVALHVDACIGGLDPAVLARCRRPRVARVGLPRRRRHQHERRPAQVRLRAEGRVGAAAARPRPAARPVLRHDPLARVSGRQPDACSARSRPDRSRHPGRSRSRSAGAGFAELAATPAERATAALIDAIAGIEGLRVVGDPVGPLIAVAVDETSPRTAASIRITGRMPCAAAGGCSSSSPRPSSRTAPGFRPRRTSRSRPVTEAALDELIPVLVSAADAVRGVPHVDVTALLSALPPVDPSALDSDDRLGGAAGRRARLRRRRPPGPAGAAHRAHRDAAAGRSPSGCSPSCWPAWSNRPESAPHVDPIRILRVDPDIQPHPGPPMPSRRRSEDVVVAASCAARPDGRSPVRPRRSARR